MTSPLHQCNRLIQLPTDEAADLANRLAFLALISDDAAYASLTASALLIAERLHQVAENLATLAGVPDRRAA